MKKLIIFIFIFLAFVQVSFSQGTLKIDVKQKKKQVIYFDLNEKNELEYNLIENELDYTKSVNAKENSLNVYLKWLNPLRYKLNWKDSLGEDDRDKAINEFVNLLIAQFGKPVSELNTPSGFLPKTVGSTDSSEIKGIDFSDKELLLWLIHLRSNQKYLSKTEILKINKLGESLKTLDELDSYNVNDTASRIYKSLFNYSSIKDYTNDFSNQKAAITAVENKFVEIEKLRGAVSDQLKSFSVKDPMLNSYIKAVLTAYLDRTLTNVNNDKKIISKLKPVLEIMSNSVNDRSSNPGTPEYFKVRSVEFDNGKKLETCLTIDEFEFNEQTKEFKQKKQIVKKNFVFQRYDIFDVTVSSGVFYGNTIMPGFGVATDSLKNLIVAEDNISKNHVIPALFLNFSLNISRYVSPLIQVGIDPTKKRPFVLLGGGFIIGGAKRFAISGGPIWSFTPTLDKLRVGDKINSTTDLEKDVKYEFNADPKGWYFGIQYNF